MIFRNILEIDRGHTRIVGVSLQFHALLVDTVLTTSRGVRLLGNSGFFVNSLEHRVNSEITHNQRSVNESSSVENAS